MYSRPQRRSLLPVISGPALVAWWVGVAIAYAMLARLGLLLAFEGTNISPIWPPAGLALGALCLVGWRVWPGIALGAILANWSGLPGPAVGMVALGNLAEALVAYGILTYFRASPCLETVRSVGLLMLAIALSAPVAATVGVITLGLVGLLSPGNQAEAWGTWVLGDATGQLMLAPVITIWSSALRTPRVVLTHAERWEALGLALMLVALAMLAFTQLGSPVAAIPLTYLLFPLVVWVTLRFGLRGASLAGIVLGLIVVMGAAWNHGPFPDFRTLNERLLTVQALIASLVIIGITLGAMLEERRAAEAELLLSSASVAHAHDLILWIDEGNHLVHANPAAITRLGYPLKDIVGQPMTKVAEELDSGSWRHSLQHTPVQESILKAADGARIPVEVSITRIVDPRLPGNYSCAIARDLTERKAMDVRFEQMAKMEALGRLAGGIAHDFNNVLAIIIGYAESVQNRNDLADPTRKAIGHIRTAGERAAGMTRQLLAFSRQQVLEPRLLDLGVVAAESVPLLERLIGSQVRVHLERPDGPLTVRADPTQIQQVLMNLAANARDAMPSGGELSIILQRVAVTAREARALARHNPHDADVVCAGKFLLLEVRDTGEGMPPETRRRLFEPFFTTKPAGKGTGLGLSSVHGIVLQSGGFVTVDSVLGRGTSFSIYLPALECPADDPTSRHTRADLRHHRVLVVDDQQVVRDLVAAMLDEVGHQVRTAADADSALALAREAMPDLLVTDLAMPGGGGAALAETLRALKPGLRVIYISGFSEGQLSDTLPPDSRFLAKPFRREALLNAVAELWG